MNTSTSRRSAGRGRTTARRPRSGNTYSSGQSRGNARGRRPQGGGNRFQNNRPKGKRAQPSFDPTQFINKNPVEVIEEVYKPTHTFADFALDGRLLQTLKQLGLHTPSPIQDKAIPDILEGRDVVGLAQTGTGKTAAFLLPLIERKKLDPKGVTLVLSPTRELATQIEAELQKLAKSFRFHSTVCVGGTGIGPQLRQLRKPNHFIIGTPGRIKDLMGRGAIPVSRVNAVVLDEADRMLDMGFIHDMREILGELPTKRQTLLFSATMDEKAAALTNDFMRDPITISVKKKDVTDSIAQDVVRYQHAHKFDVLTKLLADQSFKRVLIFGAMKHSVEKLGQALHQSGVPADSIHGNKNHSQRQRALARFKRGETKVLVATDVAARGIHVDDVTHVINYDLPNTFSDYVHRIGRTGRGDKRGQALTFVAE